MKLRKAELNNVKQYNNEVYRKTERTSKMIKQNKRYSTRIEQNIRGLKIDLFKKTINFFRKNPIYLLNLITCFACFLTFVLLKSKYKNIYNIQKEFKNMFDTWH